MKKIISLLLAVVLTLSLLSTVSLAASMPPQIHPELASIKLTCTGDDSVEYYFEDLSQAVIDWACKNLPGRKIITLLQDTEVFSLTESNQFTIPLISAHWYNKDLKAAKEFPLVLDLGGNTLSYYGGGNLFFFERIGMDVKNGTLIYTNSKGKARAPFCCGTSAGATGNSSGTSCYDPILNLENVHIYNNAGPIVNSFVYNPTVNITNSVLWTAGDANALSFSKTSQKNAVKAWEGPFEPRVNIVNSILGSDKYYFLGGNDVKAMVADSIVVSNSTSNPVATSCKSDITYTAEPVMDKNWSMTLRDGRTVTGKAFPVGTAPATLPFTDVKSTDWFYSYVEELYGAGVVAGQTATTFNPNGNLTYGAALKLLVVGLTAKDPGNAIGAHWATNYLEAAKKNGWTDIDASKLDTPITREAFCVIAAKAGNLTEQPAANKFTDTTNPAVLALVKAGVINGMNETTFAPAGILTRAQISKIISILLKL